MLINVQHILTIKGFHPVAVSEGSEGKPLISIGLNLNNISYPWLVHNNVSRNNQLIVNDDTQSKKISIEYYDQIKASRSSMISIDYSLETPNIYLLDLRPIGYNISGDNNGLLVGNSRIKGNSMTNVNTFIGLE